MNAGLLSSVAACLIAVCSCNSVSRHLETVRIRRSIDTMTVEQKVANLIMVSSLDPDAAHYAARYGVGGLIVMDRSSTAGLASIRQFRDSLAKSRPSLEPLVAIDAEYGVGMRFRDLEKFPYARSMSFLPDSLIGLLADSLARQVSSYGINVNFAPVVDVDTNPDNPVIGRRSFSQSPSRVADCASIYAASQRKAGVISCAKHFPGHGDTRVDSHKALPVLEWDRARLDSIELYPFRRMIEDGIEMIMVGHLSVPSLDASGTPASISPLISHSFLRDTLGFRGVVITDALNMRGVLDACPSDGRVSASANAALFAYKAGADILLMPDDVPGAIDIISSAIRSSSLSEEDLDKRLERVLSLTFSSSGLNGVSSSSCRLRPVRQ